MANHRRNPRNTNTTEYHRQTQMTRRCIFCTSLIDPRRESHASVQPVSALSHIGVAGLCKSCGARSTRREISDRALSDADDAQRVTPEGFKRRFKESSLEEKNIYRNCHHLVKTDKRQRCGLDLPEFMTQHAQDWKTTSKTNDLSESHHSKQDHSKISQRADNRASRPTQQSCHEIRQHLIKETWLHGQRCQRVHQRHRPSAYGYPARTSHESEARKHSDDTPGQAQPSVG